MTFDHAAHIAVIQRRDDLHEAVCNTLVAARLNETYQDDYQHWREYLKALLGQLPHDDVAAVLDRLEADDVIALVMELGK